ncbi:MAG: TetR/AcrR family transcriptional regulator [Christensenellales bacterium]|jgi:AcrR family transcriptional regulator
MSKRYGGKREQILDAALRLVARYNDFNITVRQIAAEAKVNVAAINYYFKSKKEMMAQMEKLFMDNLHDAFTPVCEKTLSPDERLKEWVKKSLGYARRYPGILVFLKDKFSNPKDNEFENAMRRALSEKFTLLRELILDSVRPERQEEELLIMTLGAVMLLPLIADMPGMGLPKDLDEHIQYVITIIEKFKSR